MGVLDRWLQRFLKDEPTSTAPTTEPTTAKPATTTAADTTDDDVPKIRALLTTSAAGRAYAESADFQSALNALDGAGRSRAGDALLADALLVSPAIGLRRQLADRLVFRGERAQAKTLLEKLTLDPAHAPFAWEQLAQAAEADGDVDAARAASERILAYDAQNGPATARLRRLPAPRDDNAMQARRAVARLLGTRAAGARYEILDELGRGGAATVFRARDTALAREVALKVFRERPETGDALARATQEARIAASFDHPHIVPVLDLDAARGLLVMHYCDGGSLQARLSNEGALTTVDALELGAVLLRTLADVHAQGHVHLDVKPSNLLFSAGRLMLADFGVAGLRQRGAAAGTRDYMAPEQWHAAAVGGAAADAYAAGIVISEMFDGKGEGRGRRARLTSLPAGPRRRALLHVLEALTHEDPALRLVNGHQAAEMLLVAGAFPDDDAAGAALASHLHSLAERHGAVERLRHDPLVSLLVKSSK